MRLAVTFTVNDRPRYFEQVLESWAAARGKEDVSFFFSCEPFNYEDGTHRGTCVDMAEKWIKDNGVVGRAYCNSKRFGVLHNPYIALQRAFLPRIDYAILAEDDLLVSDDILEYHKWAAETYRDDEELAMACSFSPFDAAPTLTSAIARVPNFACVWLWGTWKDRWEQYIGPTWDHDYSTGEDSTGPGGWDWHLNKRVLPSLGKKSLQPLVSRVENIGELGTHNVYMMPVVPAPAFRAHQEPASFWEMGT